jgi:hypothetical protein
MSENNNSGAPVAPVSQSPVSTPQSNTPQGSPDNQVAALQDVAQNGTPTQQAAAKKMIKEIRYKANSQEYTEALPFEIPEDQVEWMQKQLSLNKGAQHSMQKYGQLESEVKQFGQAMKSDTAGTLKRLGIDPKQFAAAMLEEELRLNAMTPDQREREELKTQLKQLKEQQAKEKEDFSKKELERVTQIEYERISTKIEKAIDTSGLPKDPATVKRIANYMLIGNNMNIKFEPEELVEVVREDMLREVQSLIKALGPDKAEQLVGKDFLKQVRQKNVAKAKQTGATAKSGLKDVGNKPKTDVPKTEKKTFKQHFGF